MSAHIQFLIVGLGAGAALAALAMGLVVIYRGTGIINFAQGAIAVWCAYVYDELRRSGDLVMPWVGLPHRIHLADSVGAELALPIALLSTALIGALAHLLVFRPLRPAPTLAKVVAGVGLMITLQALILIQFGTAARSIEAPVASSTIRLGDIAFASDRVYLPLLALALAAALWAWFRFTRAGIATRAASENELGAALLGWSPDRLALVTWILGCVTSGLVVLLVAPSTGLPGDYVLAVVPALAVALVGRLSSLWLACLAGLALGALQSQVVLLTTRSWWPEWAVAGVVDVIPLLAIVVTLFVAGRTLPERGAQLAERLPAVIVPRNRPATIALLTGAGVLALALTSGSVRFGVVTSMVMMVMAVSFVVLTGFVGQISLAQAALAGSAGFLLSHVFGDLPFPLSMLASALAAGALGMLVGLPALRVRGVQLAVVTLAGAVAVEEFVFRNPQVSPMEGNPVASASLLGIDLGVRSGTDLTRLPFALMVLAVLVGVVVLAGNLLRGQTGRVFLAVRANERAAASAGVPVARVKLFAVALAATIAGVAGTLIGYSRGQLSADSFTVLAGLSFLAFAYIGGITSISGALIAGLLAPLGIVYVVLDRYVDLGEYYLLLSGVALMVNAVAYPSGIAGALHDAVERLRRQTRRPAVEPIAVPATATAGADRGEPDVP